MLTNDTTHNTSIQQKLMITLRDEINKYLYFTGDGMYLALRKWIYNTGILTQCMTKPNDKPSIFLNVDNNLYIHLERSPNITNNMRVHLNCYWPIKTSYLHDVIIHMPVDASTNVQSRRLEVVNYKLIVLCCDI